MNLLPNARYILTLLVAAQIVFYAVWNLFQGVQAGILEPLRQHFIGSDVVSVRVGIFDIGMVLGGLVSCLVCILLGPLLLKLVLNASWRWISRLFPDSGNSQTAAMAKPVVSESEQVS